jgi:hypothetical protein
MRVYISNNRSNEVASTNNSVNVFTKIVCSNLVKEENTNPLEQQPFKSIITLRQPTLL